jgi:hypothetical protein
VTRTDAPGGEPFADHLGAALARVDREHDTVSVEAEAFGALVGRLRALDADTAAAATGQLGSTAGGAGGGGAGTVVDHSVRAGGGTGGQPDDPVREAYEQTVMNTPHYDDEYGDTYAESVAAEFGPDLAAALAEPRQLTPAVQRQVVAAARDARARRERLLSALAAEREAVTDARAELDAAREALVAVRSRPFYECDRRELGRLAADLDDLEARCSGLAERRQAGDLEPSPASFSLSDATLPEYVYQQLPVTYPVLDAVGAAADAVAETRRAVERAGAVLDAADAADSADGGVGDSDHGRPNR